VDHCPILREFHCPVVNWSSWVQPPFDHACFLLVNATGCRNSISNIADNIVLPVKMVSVEMKAIYPCSKICTFTIQVKYLQLQVEAVIIIETTAGVVQVNTDLTLYTMIYRPIFYQLIQLILTRNMCRFHSRFCIQVFSKVAGSGGK
jgi:hypothetical protein